MRTVTPGLVLREVKVGENDRILTLLTPDLGVISASAKGSLRLKSKLFSACGLFCYSEFALYQGKGIYLINDAQVKQMFFGLTESVERTALAMYMAEFVQTLAPVGKEAETQLRLILNSFYVLSKGLRQPRMVKAVYELRALSEAGFMPNLLCCAACQKYEDRQFFFNTNSGELLCGDCAKKQGLRPNLDGASLTALRHVVLVDDKKIFGFAIPDSSLELLSHVAEQYAIQHLDKPLKSLEFLKTAL